MIALYNSASGPFNLDLKEVSIPELNPVDNVLINVKACAVCGMDHRIYHGTYPCNPPFTLGHELVGIVSDIVGDSNGLKKGDRVTLTPHLYSCGHCAACKIGLTQLCKDKKTVGIDRDGAMTNYVAVPAKHLHKIPATVPDKLACITEPLTMIYGNIAEALEGKIFSNIAIIGAGQIGLLGLISSKFCKLNNAIVVDRNCSKEMFPIAEKLGADHIINIDEENLYDRVMELTNGDGVDLVLETSGSEGGISSAADILRVGGTLIAMGMSRKETISVPWDRFIKKAINICFHMQSNYKYIDDVISNLTHPYTDLSPIITKEVHLNEWKELFEYMDTNRTLKNIIYTE